MSGVLAGAWAGRLLEDRNLRARFDASLARLDPEKHADWRARPLPAPSGSRSLRIYSRRRASGAYLEVENVGAEPVLVEAIWAGSTTGSPFALLPAGDRSGDLDLLDL